MTNQNLDEEIYGAEQTGTETISISELELKAFEEDKELRDSIMILSRNKHFKRLRKAYIDNSLVTLGLNLGVQSQMRQELVLEIEARRIFNEFLSMAVERGNQAEEILRGV